MKSLFSTFLLASTITAVTQNQALLDLMAQAKVETDLGNYDAAIRALTALTESGDAPPALRAEGLVRLGVARRGAGDLEGAVQAFEKASKGSGMDGDTKALLVQALGGALPANERWADVWPRVSFTVDRSEPKRPTLVVVWPDVPPKQVYSGQPITLDFKDGDIQNVFRLFADLAGLNVVVFPGVRGRVTFKAHSEPWDSCLDRILAANGLAYQAEDNVLLIGRPQQLEPRRPYSGQRMNLDYRDRDLNEGLAEIAASGGAAVVIDPAVGGRITIKLKQVRWDQAFDVVGRLNGLDWRRDGDTLKVFPRKKAESR